MREHTNEQHNQTNREVEYQVDALCAEYVDAAEAADKTSQPMPDVRPFLTRAQALGQVSAQLSALMAFANFVIDWHLILRDLPEPDETAVAELSPAFEKALARIQAMERDRETR